MTLDDVMDRLVAEYSDRRSAGGRADKEDLLAQVPARHRPALERCFQMIDGGLAGAPTAHRPLGPGSELAGYRIVDVLGRGGMAVVYRAEQLELGRLVALKVLRPGLALERRHVERFHREALSVARLNHPNIVQIHAVGEADGHHFLAMEWVDGPSLAEIYRSLPPGDDRTARDLADATGIADLAHHETYEQALAELLAPVARAIGVAHDLGIVHRDVKPSNILVHRDGRAMIADFGLAKGEGDLEVSLTGEPLGTPYYMSPEQVQESEPAVDARTDVYSFGVTLYEGLVGRRPFRGDSLVAIFDAIRHEDPPPLRQLVRQCSRDAQAVVARAMAREATDRYRSALELASDLVSLAEGSATAARAQEAGPLRRAVDIAGKLLLPGGYRYTSTTCFLGMPLVDINKGFPRPGDGLLLAKGWLAVGQVAVGGVAFGRLALGASPSAG